MPDQTGKTALITGANTGIGFESAKVFAGKGARVLLGCRNLNTGNEAIARIITAHADADVQLVELDLADLASVRRAAEVVAQEPRLGVLVNNAASCGTPRQSPSMVSNHSSGSTTSGTSPFLLTGASSGILRHLT